MQEVKCSGGRTESDRWMGKVRGVESYVTKNTGKQKGK